MKKIHLVEFSDESANVTGKKSDGISMFLSEDERISQIDVNGVPLISGNGSGLVKLGELLIQIGLSEYKNGFHLHVHENFDEEKPEILIVAIRAAL